MTKETKIQFIKKNLGSSLARKRRGRFGTIHWELPGVVGDYQDIRNTHLVFDSEEQALGAYFDRKIE